MVIMKMKNGYVNINLPIPIELRDTLKEKYKSQSDFFAAVYKVFEIGMRNVEENDILDMDKYDLAVQIINEMKKDQINFKNKRK
jgi:hypothetical protein